jgi:hypothetical protein
MSFGTGREAVTAPTYQAGLMVRQIVSWNLGIRVMSRNGNGSRSFCTFSVAFDTLDQARRGVAPVNRQ